MGRVERQIVSGVDLAAHSGELDRSGLVLQDLEPARELGEKHLASHRVYEEADLLWREPVRVLIGLEDALDFE